jgi:hypothetical protein
MDRLHLVFEFTSHLIAWSGESVPTTPFFMLPSYEDLWPLGGKLVNGAQDEQ